MVKVCVEVHEGDVPFRATVRAESISQAVRIAKGGYPDRDVRVVFPIDPAEFFARVPEQSGRTAAAGGCTRPTRAR
jgi:hypothetical protein